MERREGAGWNGWSGFAGGLLVGGLVATGGVLVALRYKEYLLPKGLLIAGKDEYDGQEKIVSGASFLQGNSVKRKGIRWVLVFGVMYEIVASIRYIRLFLYSQVKFTPERETADIQKASCWWSCRKGTWREAWSAGWDWVCAS